MNTTPVLVCGLGLMGGSLAAALHHAGWSVLLHHRRPEVSAEAARRGWGRQVEYLEDGAGEAALAIICTPVSTIAGIARRLAAAGPQLIITDVGSVKAPLCRELDDLAAAGRFVGSHPMCGSHLQGLANARPDLYQGALTAITTHPQAPEHRIRAVEQLWQAIGCRCLRLEPERHDEAVAEASHLPHVLAAATAAMLSPQALPLAASGFRDTSRVAAAGAALWRDILCDNRAAVIRALDRTTAHLNTLVQSLTNDDTAAVEEWLQAGQDGRARFEQHQHHITPPPSD